MVDVSTVQPLTSGIAGNVLNILHMELREVSDMMGSTVVSVTYLSIWGIVADIHSFMIDSSFADVEWDKQYVCNYQSGGS